MHFICFSLYSYLFLVYFALELYIKNVFIKTKASFKNQNIISLCLFPRDYFKSQGCRLINNQKISFSDTIQYLLSMNGNTINVILRCSAGNNICPSLFSVASKDTSCFNGLSVSMDFRFHKRQILM